MKMKPGVLLSERYRLDDRVATGGVGEVWKATDQVTGWWVAVKVLRDRHVGDPWFRERFRAEAHHTAVLSHPGVAEVLDYVEEGDLAYLVMEFLAGRPLSTLLRGGRQLGTPLTLGIIGQVAVALQAAHDAGVIHRDIKPANLIVGYDGQVKVTDFGIARAADMATLTQPGVVVGTAVYMSPEQAEAQRVTSATDVYSLGVVCYECLAGRVPFLGSTPVEIAFGHVRDQPPPLPAYVPAVLRDLVGRCLAKDPCERPASMIEIAETAYTIAETLVPARAAAIAPGVGQRRGVHRGRHRGAPRWRPRPTPVRPGSPGTPRWRHRAGVVAGPGRSRAEGQGQPTRASKARLAGAAITGLGSSILTPHPIRRRRAVVASLAGTTVLASGLLLGGYVGAFPGKAPFRGTETSVSPTPSVPPSEGPNATATPSVTPGGGEPSIAQRGAYDRRNGTGPDTAARNRPSPSGPDTATPSRTQPSVPVPSRNATGWPEPDAPPDSSSPPGSEDISPSPSPSVTVNLAEEQRSGRYSTANTQPSTDSEDGDSEDGADDQSDLGTDLGGVGVGIDLLEDSPRP
ncbi:MAG: protein kinase [Streptosporangiales bacterium]|nr:protein kinase [Streptosporangiales bacterium]